MDLPDYRRLAAGQIEGARVVAGMTDGLFRVTVKRPQDRYGIGFTRHQDGTYWCMWLIRVDGEAMGEGTFFCPDSFDAEAMAMRLLASIVPFARHQRGALLADPAVSAGVQRVMAAAMQVTAEGHAHVFVSFFGHVSDLDVHAHPPDQIYKTYEPHRHLLQGKRRGGLSIRLGDGANTRGRALAELDDVVRRIYALRDRQYEPEAIEA